MASKEYYDIAYGLKDLAKELNCSDTINTIDSEISKMSLHNNYEKEDESKSFTDFLNDAEVILVDNAFTFDINKWEKENQEEIDEELYDGDWTQEDEEDFNTYDEESITKEQEQFYEEIRDVLQSLIDGEDKEDENKELDEKFVSNKELKKHFFRHCLANDRSKVSTKKIVYYDFNTIQEYSNYENELNKNFQSNSDTIILSDPYNIEEVNDAFLQLFKNNTYIIFGWEWNLRNNKGIVQLRIHSFASNVTTNYKTNDTLDIIIRTSQNNSITLYAIDLSRMKNKIFNILKKYSNLPLVKSKDNNKLLDNLQTKRNNINNHSNSMILEDSYDDDWTIEDEDDIENYEEDNPITPEQKAFGEELKDFFQSLIDKEIGDEDIDLDEEFVSNNSLNKHFYRHCLASIPNRKSKPTSIYYDFNSLKQYENYEKNTDSKFDIGNKNLKVLQGPFDINLVNEMFRKLFEGNCYLTLGWSWGFSNGNNAVQLNLHSFSSDVTTNYKGGNTIDLMIRTSVPKTITLYSVDASRLKNKLIHIFNKYSQLSLTPSKDDKKLLDNLSDNRDKNSFNILTEDVSRDDPYLKMDYEKAMDTNWKHYIFSVTTNDGELHDERGDYQDEQSFKNAASELHRRYGNNLSSINAIHSKSTLQYYDDLYNNYLKNKNNNQQLLKNNSNSTNSSTPQNNQQQNNSQQPIKRKNNPVYRQRTKNNSRIVKAFKNNGLSTDKLTQQVTDKNGRVYTKATPVLKKLRKDLYGESLGEDLEENSPYTNIKSNGIYSLNTGWVKHPVQQNIPDIDMEEFEKEFKVWEDKYFDLLDKESSREEIDNLIEDIYNLRKEGMEEDGEYSIKNLIFKEFRNLGYLDNLKELRKKEISKELSLEQLN